jgi:hypothetical protein
MTLEAHSEAIVIGDFGRGTWGSAGINEVVDEPGMRTVGIEGGASVAAASPGIL